MPSVKLRPHFLALARRVRTWFGAGQRPAKVGITSLDRGAGRSTVAFNLSASLTRIDHDSVLLIESDFGRPFISRRLGVADSAGLSDIIRCEVEPTQCIVDSPIEKFSVLSAGRVSEQDSLELPFEQLENVLKCQFERFGFLVFDLPVANELTSCYSIVPHLDGIIITIGEDRIDRKQIAEAKQRVAACGSELVGVVINRKD